MIVGQKITHRKSGRVYVISFIGKYKNDTGTWIDVVGYQGLDRNTNKLATFVRNADTFTEHFIV